MADLQADGAEVVGLRADVSDSAGAERFVLDAAAALGGVDILVPNGEARRRGASTTWT